MIPSLLSWFTDPENWTGEDGIPHRTLQHLEYTAVTLVIAALIAIPIGLWVGHTGRARWLVSLANSLRAVPTLGLLFAVALWLGPKISGDLAFTIPSVSVLVLLAIPPLLAGTYAGIEAVEPAARDAAKGVGMSPLQVLRQVELPNALPLLFSGVRSATLQVVATATIAAFVGLGGLGRYLIDGIALGDYPQTAGGAVLVAGLAVVLDGVFALVQRRTVSPGLSGRQARVGGRGKDSRSVEVEADEATGRCPHAHLTPSPRPRPGATAPNAGATPRPPRRRDPFMKRTSSAIALVAASILGLTACGGGSDPLASDTASASASSTGGSGQPIVVGGANFSESTLLAEIYAGALKAKGIDASTKLNIGSREIYLRALEDNSVQVFPEYTGALAFNYDKDYTGTDPEEVYTHVQEVLPDTLTVLDKSAAEDNDSMVVTKETATEHNLKTVDDLAAVAG